MYWCDGHTERIESADLDGGRRKTLFAGSPDADPFGIALHGAFVYWTDWAARGLFRARRDGTGGLEQLLSGVFRGLNDVKYFNRTAARGTLCIRTLSFLRQNGCDEKTFSASSYSTSVHRNFCKGVCFHFPPLKFDGPLNAFSFLVNPSKSRFQ